MRKILGILLCSIFIVAASACDNASANAGLVTLATGPNASNNYVVMVAIANMLSTADSRYTFQPEITSGGTENIRMLASGGAQIGLAQVDAMVAGYEGTREFDESTKGSINFVMGAFETCIHQFVTADSDIETFTDIKGKTCGVAKGTMAQVFWPMILSYHGMTESDVDTKILAVNDIFTGIQDGTLDYGINMSGLPNAKLTELCQTTDIRLLSFDKAYTDAMVADNSYFSYTTIPGDLYDTGEDTLTISTRNAIICRADADEQLVYDWLKTILDNQDELAALGSVAAEFSSENALEYSDLIPMHPGAERLYRELGMIK